MKIFRAVLAAALCLTVFSGCGPNAENTKPASDDKAFLTITDDTGRTVVPVSYTHLTLPTKA